MATAPIPAPKATTPTTWPIEATVVGGGTEPTRKDTDKRTNNARGLGNVPAARKR